MNKKINSLTREYNECLNSGELELSREKFLSLKKYFYNYRVFGELLNFKNSQVPIQFQLDILSFQFEIFLFQGDFQNALSVIHKISLKVNKVYDDEFHHEIWKKINDLIKDKKDSSHVFNLLKNFIYLEYSLRASLKYGLVISGRKAIKGFLTLCVFHKENDNYGILLNKIILRMNDESLKKVYHNTFPHLLKKRFRDSHLNSIQDNKDSFVVDKDITIIQGL